MCKLKEGRKLHGKVKRKRKREREKESQSAANRACISMMRADSLSRRVLSTRTCAYTDGSTQKLRLFRTTRNMEQRREKEGDRRRKEIGRGR